MGPYLHRLLPTAHLIARLIKESPDVIKPAAGMLSSVLASLVPGLLIAAANRRRKTMPSGSRC
ncbi:hypothetical protein [Rhodopila sp.]|uniref:hypothetical protein n=1 Tax=Rhodopila sp. TaxID=2480087 RepID=UPI002C570AFA|nr:hypothetical protein [Rhodopila sp.]HVZ09400.1 hypothetical protein [Rhodopila sp.]